jgi:ketosteroid isomerase-like protein
MKKLLGLLVGCSLLFSCGNDKKTAEDTKSPAATDQAAASKDYEIGDMKYVDIAKKHFGYLGSGDIDSWMAEFADNATYRWNNFDSLLGKAAITDYWKKRRTDIIDSMSFANDIWLPMKVNKSQAPGHLTGNYALGWYTVKAKYKTGKSMSQRVHTVFHFNENDKIDRVSQYLDRVPIMAAMAK